MADAETSTSARAVKDTARLFGARVAAGAFSVFFSAWLIRLLPEDELAIWPIVLVLGAAIEALGSLGMGDTFVRRIPRHLVNGEREEASALLKTGVISNLLACAVLTLILATQKSWTAKYLLLDASQTDLVTALSLAAFFLALRGRLGWGLMATQQFTRMAVLSLFSNAARTPLAVVLYLHLGIRGLLLAFTIVPAVACLLSLAWLWPHLWRSAQFQRPWRLLRFSLPFYGVSIAGLLTGRAHLLLVGLLTSREILAAYFVASKVADYIRELNRFGVSVVTPKLAEKGEADADCQSRVLCKCSRYLFLVLLPMHLGLAVLATPVVRLYAGDAYAEAGVILSILALYAFLEVFYRLHTAHIQVFAPPVHLLGLQVFAGVLNLGVMTALVIPYGATGAAAAKLLSYAILSIAGAWVLRRTMSLRYDTPALRSALMAGAALCAAAFVCNALLAQGAGAVVVGLFAGVAAYLLALTGRLQGRDVDLIFGLLPMTLRNNGVGRRLSRLLKRWLVIERTAPSTGTAEDGLV